jgi:hypothetical protein
MNYIKKTIFAATILAILSINGFAQVAINTTGDNPDPSAILDLQSTTKGFLVPRVTTAQRNLISTTQSGLLVYDLTTKSFWHYDNTQSDWIELGGGSNVSEINDLSDGIYDGSSLFLGNGSGSADDGNNYNTGIGINALNDNISGTENSIIGYGAGEYNTSGSFNTMFGSFAGRLNTIGENNINIGTRANFNNQTGSNNTIIGNEAGRGVSAHSKSGNIFIGYRAGYNETGDNKLYIANSATLTPLIGGDFSAGLVEINGTLKITGGTPGLGKVLTSDADGDATWEIPTNYASEINDLSDAINDNSSIFFGKFSGLNDDGGNFNVSIGNNALKDVTSGTRNISFGDYSLFELTEGIGNTAIGYASQYFNTSGFSNVSIGVRSLYRTTTQSNLVAIGDSALYNNGSGATQDHEAIENTAIGSKALYSNTTGYLNTSIGFQSLYSNTIGSGNTANGRKSLYYNTSGAANTGVGSASLYYNTTGTYNVALGYQAMAFNTGGDNNISIGTNALYSNTTGNNNTSVGYYSMESNTTGQSNIAIGVESLYSNTVSSNLVAIGDSALYNNGTGATQYYEATENTAIGSKALYSNTTGSSNTSIGFQSLYYNTIGKSNTGNGFRSLYHNTTGSKNSAYGMNSLYDNTTGDYNTGIGYQSLNNNTTGNNNVAVGTYALFYNSIGSENTSVGVSAGESTADISGCVFIGYEAGKANTSNNKLFIDNSSTYYPLIGGDFSTNQVDINGTIKITGGTPGIGKILTSDADGDATWETPTTYASQLNDLSDAIWDGTSLFIGDQVGTVDDGANFNTALGDEAFKANTSGQRNTAVGYKSLIASNGGSNTAIGFYALGANTSGDHNTAVGSNAIYSNTTGNYNTAIGYNAFYSGTYSNSVAIGYNASISGNNQIHLGNTSITEIKGQVSFTTYSDGRIKENVKEDVGGLNFILKLRPVTYNINLDKENLLLGIGDDADLPNKYDIEKVKKTGFIAQEVEAAAREVDYDFSGIQKPKHEKDLYGLSYAEFVVPLVKSVQELNEKLEKENAELKARIEKLEQLLIK